MAKISVKLVVSEKNDQGEAPVEIWVNHDYSRRKKRLFWVGVKHWDKKDNKVLPTHPNCVKMNRMIKLTEKTFRDRIFDFEMEGVEFTADDITHGSIKKGRTMSELARDMADEKARMGQLPNSRAFIYLAEMLDKFMPGVGAKDVDVKFVDRFKAFLLAQERIKSRSTVHRYIKKLKQVLKDEYEKGEYDDRKVLAYKMTISEPKKDALTMDELHRWITADVPGLEVYRDFFLVMYYLRGARVGDVLQLTPGHIHDGRILYTEQKTGKHQNQLITPQLWAILKRYENRSRHYLMPIMKMRPDDPKRNDGYQQHIKVKTSALNFRYKIIAEVAGINKRITNHVARHTFASHAKDAGLSTGMIQLIFNHSAESTTEKYIQSLKAHEQLDDAVRLVFG